MRALLAGMLLMVPPAMGSHPFPSQEELLREGADLSVHLLFRGEASATGSARKAVQQSIFEDTYSWSSRWDWTAAGHMEQGSESTLDLGGTATVELRETTYRETTTERTDGGTRVTTSLLTTGCDGRARLQGTRASFTLEGAEVVIRLANIRPGFVVADGCEATLVETDTHGPGSTRSERADHELSDVAITSKVAGEGDIDLRVPITAGKTILIEAFTGELPAGNDGLAGRLCGRTHPALTDMVVPCHASGTVEVRLFADACDALAESANQHRADLEVAVAAKPASPDERALLAWADAVSHRTAALLSDARAHALMECEPPIDVLDAVVQAIATVRDALGEAANDGKLTEEGAKRLLGVERASQLIGGPEASGDAAAGLRSVFAGADAPSGATASVAVHSPVALRAVTLDGHAVGWNATTNRTETGIEGATREGEPGGAQRLVLPEGAYTIEVVEQEYKPYLLLLEGPDREEAHLVDGVPGRTTRVPVLLHDWGDATGARLDLFVAPRPVSGADVPPREQDQQGASIPAGGAFAAVAGLGALGILARSRRHT